MSIKQWVPVRISLSARERLPEIGVIYPALLGTREDGFSVELFPTEEEAEEEDSRRTREAIQTSASEEEAVEKACKSSLPVRAKLIDSTRMAVELPNGEWLELTDVRPAQG